MARNTSQFVSHTCLVALIVGLLAGCVTTTTGGRDKSVDHNAALETRVQLTLTYVQQGNRDQARVNLNKARDISSNDPRVFNAEGMLLQLEGETELAEAAFKNALARDPNYSAASNNYGLFLFKQERFEEALVAFERAGEDVEYERRDAALTNLGATALELQRPDKAKASFEQALRLNPRNSNALTALAQVEFNARNYSSAKTYLDRLQRFGRPTPASLWLGIRLERIFGNLDQEASLALALKNLYPYSAEYLEYKRLLEE
jgi:type IV pilus assembly protein PilF